MLKKPVYENEINVELYAVYASENNHGQKKCPTCGKPCTTVAQAVENGHTFPEGTSLSGSYCSHCDKVI